MTRPNGTRRAGAPRLKTLAWTAVALTLLYGTSTVQASVGDRLPEFRQCVQSCMNENCAPGKAPTPIPLLHRILLWDCPSECDYTCQHIITAERLRDNQPFVQFHGKWPFKRFLGMQEPFSVLCSALNLWANLDGLRNKVWKKIPQGYGMRPFYEWLAYVNAISWIASMVFHTRDFVSTEQVDYFAAGANVLFGLYYTVVHHWRLDRPSRIQGEAITPGANGVEKEKVEQERAKAKDSQTTVTSGLGRDSSANSGTIFRLWTTLCVGLYTAHVAYLKLYKWDYAYNMAANTIVGLVANMLWIWFSVSQYRRTGKKWTLMPAVTAVWVMSAISLELFDFSPWWGTVDAHSLWHLWTVAPTFVWYDFLVEDALDDIAGLGVQRLKQ